MQILTRITRLIFESEADKWAVLQILEDERTAFNIGSTLHFNNGDRQPNNIKLLHQRFYNQFRVKYPDIPSQIVIKAQQDILSSYRTVKKLKYKITQPIYKKKLSLQLDARLYSWYKQSNILRLTTHGKRVNVNLQMTDWFKEYFDKYEYGDPLIFERNGEIFISFPFKVPTPEPEQPKYAIGVDLGIRRYASTSEGLIFQDKKFNARKRTIRYRKRKLQSLKTKSAKRRLKTLRHKEQNTNKNFCYNLANLILKTKADVICLEDLTNIKQNFKKKNKFKSQNKISQVPFYLIKFIITYKAGLVGKQVVLVNPAYTSQIDCVSGKLGERKGCRFYPPIDKRRKNQCQLVYDADLNAAVNIGKLNPFNLPVPYSRILDGQAIVNRPIVGNFGLTSVNT